MSKNSKMTNLNIFVIALVSILFGCSKPASTIPKGVSECLTGKLVKKGICGQYVVELQSTGAQDVEVEKSWNDPSSATNYQNVFTVANPCDFPSTIMQGEVFTFTLVSNGTNTCGFCQAYTPTPSSRNFISLNCKTN
jgi:hypothetical protein